MNVTGTLHTGIHVADLERSLAFYRDLLGCEVLWERVVDAEYIGELVGYPGVELHQALLALPGSDHRLELMDYRGVERVAVDTRSANPGTAHLAFSVSNVQELRDRLVERGCPIVAEPVKVPSGPNAGRFAVYAIDPDGVRIELVSDRVEA